MLTIILGIPEAAFLLPGRRHRRLRDNKRFTVSSTLLFDFGKHCYVCKPMRFVELTAAPFDQATQQYFCTADTEYGMRALFVLQHQHERSRRQYAICAGSQYRARLFQRASSVNLYRRKARHNVIFKVTMASS